jgi:hypothetical protein
MKLYLRVGAAVMALCVGGASAAEEGEAPNPLLEPELGIVVGAEKSGDLKVKMESKPLGDDVRALNPRLVGGFIIGGEDLVTYYCVETPMPAALSDLDGGTIRFILQHEVDKLDQLRVLEANIAMEHTDDRYGERGRYPGRYGWTSYAGPQSAASWILGDKAAHAVASPWSWAWVDDFKRFRGNAVLGGDNIQICSHPAVTTRVLFLD